MEKIELLCKLEKYGQSHLLDYYDTLGAEERGALSAQIEGMDFEKAMKLYEDSVNEEVNENGTDEDVIEPIPYVEKSSLDPELRAKNLTTGKKLLKKGQFAVITMAGGQGTRLGHNGPKGTYDIGVSSYRSLFEIQCMRIKKAAEDAGKAIPWYIMTSRENDADTRAFFEKNAYFGYDEENIIFFVQNMLPMITFDGKIVLDRKDHIKEGADGHGGIFAALKSSKCYDDMKRRGIKWVFVGGIDNVLLRMCDAEFIGFAENSGAKIAAKSLVKRDAKEGVGVFCRRNGKPYVIEYTEISEEMANAKNENGSWKFGDAHILCNIFSMDSIDSMLASGDGLPYHVARKKTNIVKNGEITVPEKANAFKFEAFIFDAFEKFDDIAILRVERNLEFAPVKNKEGQDSPETAKALFEAAEEIGDIY